MESFSSALFVVKYFDKGVVECGLGKHRVKNIIGLLCLYTGGRGGGCVFDVCARTLFDQATLWLIVGGFLKEQGCFL